MLSKKPLTVPAIRSHQGEAPLVALTAYTAPVAELLDPHCDILLVGDSLGMVLYGMDSTLEVSLDMMIAHGRAVARKARHACVVIDLPFGSYHVSKKQAVANAARVLKETGAAAVKLEGGREMAKTIRRLSECGIPVIGHVGLMPQRVHQMGGYKYQGRDEETANAILRDALAVEKAGAFAIVLEGVAEPLAREIAEQTAVPVIGIGASAACDGQVLVTEDMAGLNTGYIPKFVKQYGNLAGELENAVKSYAEDVRTRRFPGPEHCYESSDTLKPINRKNA